MYELESSLSPAEVVERLKSNTNLKKPRFPYFDGLDKKFQGKMDGNHLVFTRTIFYRNSFVPVLVGDIRPNGLGLGSRIRIRFRPYWPVLGFWVSWMTAAMAALILSREIEALAALVLGYLVCIIPFSIEVNITKKLLGEIIGSSKSEP